MLSIISTSASFHSVRQRAEKEKPKPSTTKPEQGPDVVIKKGKPTTTQTKI